MEDNHQIFYVLLMAFLLALFGYTAHTTRALIDVSATGGASPQHVQIVARSNVSDIAISNVLIDA